MPERWPRVEALFDAVVALPLDERGAALDRLAGGDAELRGEVQSLLTAADASGEFLATNAESFARPFLLEAATREPGDQPGLVVGRYRLLGQIGRGGMGAVWLAERSDGQFEHRVALKLIKRGMDSEEILARFLRERQILARLEHPNIARLLDGGVTDDGRPYFVMEHVAGLPIIAFCEQRRLPLEERLRLFVVACRAIGYAHRNLVVHRDIKPSNVLVDNAGELKLLDFGIARLLDDTDPQAALTAGTGRLMTPEYASPEQLTHRQVTTASDVYQLGLLLYELLSGRRPERGREPRPSAVQPGERRLKGDLDTITLRALREEPERRYPSAEDLADDVERHLSHLPIRFGGDRAAYRAGKFFRRHRIGVTAGAAMLLLTVGLLGFDAVRVRQERDRARHEADKAIEVGQLMARFLQGWSPDASDRGAVSTRKLLGDAALRASRELESRPEILAATLSILGDFHTTVGEWQAADTLLARALAIQQRLDASPTTDRAATLARRGRLRHLTGHYEEAAAASSQSLGLYRELLGRRHPETLRIQRELASVFRTWKRPVEAAALLEDVLASLDQGMGDPSPFALEVRSELGYAVYQQARYDSAIAIMRPTLEQQRAIFGPLHLSTLTTVRMLGSTLRDRGDLDEAEQLYREALRIATALYGREHLETVGALFTLTLALARKGELEEAERLAREGLDLGKRVYPDEYASWYVRGFLGAILLDRGDLAGAEEMLRRGLALARRGAPAEDPDLADLLNRLAYLTVRRDAPDADQVYREAVDFDAARPPDLADFVTDGIHFLAAAEQQKGDGRAAEEDYRRALRVYERQLPASHPYRVAADTGLRTLLQRIGSR